MLLLSSQYEALDCRALRGLTDCKFDVLHLEFCSEALSSVGYTN